MGKIANAMPTMFGSKAKVLLARVCQEEESLACYGVPPASSRSKARSPTAAGERSDLELELRVPLRLARVARAGDAAVSVTLPSRDLWGKLRGLPQPSCELFGALLGSGPCDQADAPQGWTLECRSPEAACLLLERLQTAGCIVQGLQQRYRMMDVIGFGNFGVVSKAEDLHTGAIVAIKLFTKEHVQSLTHPLLEATILRSCRHENIMEFLGVYEVTEHDVLDRFQVELSHTYAIVSEFLPGGELLTHLQRTERVTEDYARSLAKQLLSAINWVHDARIVHRDIKLENLMLTGGIGSKVKLIDFGLSASESDSEAMCMKAGSPGYVAPEVLSAPQTCKADCFSCGVILYILLAGKAPFPGRDPREVLGKNMLCQVATGPLATVSQEARAVVMGLLCKSPRDRLSASEALGHAWFTQPAPPAAPAKPAAPRAGQAAPRARHLPSLKRMQPLGAVRPLALPRAAARGRAPAATSALELDLGARPPHEEGVRRGSTPPAREGAPPPPPRAASPQATGASAAGAEAAERPTGSASAAAAAAASPPPGLGPTAERQGPLVRDLGAAAASSCAVGAALQKLNAFTAGPPKRDASPAPSVERFTIHPVLWHDVPSAGRSDSGDAARQDGSPVHAWSKQAVRDRPSFLERVSFGDIPERQDAPRAFPGRAPADLAAVRLPRSPAPPPQRYRRPVGLNGLQHCRYRSPRQC